jgi:hypothetical protein
MKQTVLALATTSALAFTRQQYSPIASIDAIWNGHMQPAQKKKEVDMGPKSQWRHDCGKLVPAFGGKHPISLSQLGKGELPGAGMHPDEIEPYQKVLKDGFMEVACVKDAMYEAGDKFGNNKFNYKMGAVVNSSIVHYNDHVAKEDREKMTPSVCFEFCRSVEDMGYFGISNGRDCYCTSFFKEMASDSSDCDSVCEGDTSLMCGGKTKNTIWSMHWCDTLEEDLEKGHDDGEGAHHELEHLCNNIKDTADAVSTAAQDMQDHFGQLGDPAASSLLQGANVFAGKWVHKAEDCLELVDELGKSLTELEGVEGGDFTDYDIRKKAEDALAAVTDHTSKAVDLTASTITGWAQAQPQAVGAAGKFLPAVLAQYYSIMYFIDKDHADDSKTPVTCDGDLIGEPVLGARPEDCAAACDEFVGKCVGFSVLAAENDGETGYICYLFSSFTSAQYYTGCDDKEERGDKFLQAKVQRHGHVGGFTTRTQHNHTTVHTAEMNSACAKKRASAGCAAAREATAVGDMGTPEKCFLKENNLWTHDQLPAYFNCLVECCEDFDPDRIFDKLTCDDILGFGFGCSDPVEAYVPKGTLLEHVCPDTCDACAAPPPPVTTTTTPAPPSAMPPTKTPVVVVTTKEDLDTPVQAMCRAKFSEFGSINLKPDPSGKNKFALRELTKADRCSY